MEKVSYHFLLLLLLGAVLYSDAHQEADQLRKFCQSMRARRTPDAPVPVRHDPWAMSNIEQMLPPLDSARSVDISDSKEDDRIAALPGQPLGLSFNQYGGYVTVDKQNGRALYYYFVESPYNPSTKPLVLWLNGGPGCSSLGYGAMEELGPFRVNKDSKTLRNNPDSWNIMANVLFLESPAGVGYSYSNTSSDYDKSGDKLTAKDAHVFLLNWFERFPEYKGRTFFISGESYAGHYVPQLAAVILDQNKKTGKTDINLRGILIGNPYLDDFKNERGVKEFYWSHGLVSDETWENITKHCKFNASDGQPCWDVEYTIDIGTIDIYNIYSPVCIRGQDGTLYPSSNVAGYDPCLDSYLETYLNDPVVQKALHARVGTKWDFCNDDLNKNWKDAPESVMPTIRWLIDSGLSVWLISGDMDSACPLISTRYSVKDLDLQITEAWRPWTSNAEIGGYIQQYEKGFTLASVRGAGHMVPINQPKKALTLLDFFMRGTLPPYKHYEKANFQ